jgi:antitoxin ParD1/3/4
MNPGAMLARFKVLIFNTSKDQVLTMPRNTSVTLGEHFEKFVADKIEQGRFQSVSEAVRAGLRILEQDEIKLEALREKLKASKESPLIEDFDPQQFLVEMRNKSGY